LTDPKIRENSADNNWLSKIQQQTTAYNQVYNQDFSYRASIEPHGSFKIDLKGNRKLSMNTSEYMIYYSDPQYQNMINDSIYKGYNFHVSRNVSGNFNISTFCHFSTFRDGNKGTESKLFNEFLDERRTVANQLGAANKASGGAISYINDKGQQDSYIDGYQNNQQDVLFGAFYNTYSGQKIKNYSTKNVFPTVPIPNWTVSWDGLGKIPSLKKTFKNIIVRHGYASTFNIAGFSNNLLYQGTDQTARMPVSVSAGTGSNTAALNSNFVPYYNINAVTITESFQPLIKFDFQFNKPGWSANVETKRDKSTTLNITGPQIVETKGQEYIVGLGYMYPKLKIKGLTIQGKVLESNLTVKVDVSYRQNLSIIRRVSDGISVPTGGTDIITLRSSVDYALTQNINLRLFYDWIHTKPQTSASFPTSNATGGFSLRINFQ
jgi:cell surface protein SprA